MTATTLSPKARAALVRLFNAPAIGPHTGKLGDTMTERELGISDRMGQILEAAGLVKCLGTPDAKGNGCTPDSRHYRLTEAGRREILDRTPRAAAEGTAKGAA